MINTNNINFKDQKSATYIALLIKYLLPIFILGIVLLTIFRVHLLQIMHHDLTVLFTDATQLKSIIFKAFIKGFRYDLVVISYIMCIPLIALIVSYILQVPTKVYVLLSKIYIILAFTILLIISFIDFPYFKYFWTHPTVTIFNWAGYGGTYGMLFQESSYYIYYLFFFLTLLLIIFASKYLIRWALNGNSRLLKNKFIQISSLFSASILLFFGTKGQLSTQSIDLQPGYFTDAFLVSDLCFTPSYYFMVTLNDSYEIKIEEMMDADKALDIVKKELKAEENKNFKNPLSRTVYPDSTKALKDYNIVIVFMESMSAAFLNQTIDGKILTPYLDSLSKQAYYFENFYSSGVHTNVGVGTTLSGYPSRFATKVMYRNPTKYKGFASALQDRGYTTSFFIPNEFEYDHMGFFLQNNGLENIFVDKNYPKEAAVNMYGVPDDFLLNFALEDMNQKSKLDKPFFSSVLTVSNHPPYIVPKEFSDVWNDDELGIVAYADNSIKNFMEKASKQDWYENTIFIFQGDHGKIIGTQKYSMPLTYNHIPLIVYSPSFTDMPQKFSQFGGQIDIYPTIMGILNKEYVNNTMGVDLLKEERPYMFFSSDTQLGCVDKDFFYVYQPRDKNEYLYEYAKGNSANVIGQNREIADRMKEYSLSMMVTTDYLETNKLVEHY